MKSGGLDTSAIRMLSLDTTHSYDSTMKRAFRAKHDILSAKRVKPFHRIVYITVSSLAIRVAADRPVPIVNGGYKYY
jgi:hypothetical protein